MNILLVDMHKGIEQSLINLGHTVQAVRIGGGLVSLPGLLKKTGFSPDLVVQMEFLGPKTYFLGLETLDCPTVFWALDSHLGLYWHKWYARLFDHVLTPHMTLFDSLPPALKPKHVSRFAWPGQARGFVPHGERRRFLGLCARVDKNREIRAWLVGLLSGAGLALTDGLSFAEMMAFYDETRVVPNECIANEVNWRLMEGASAGALVVSPDVGEDQNALLQPGTEFMIYRDGLELLDIITWAKIRPAQAEAVGFAAAQRIQAEHLPEHRAHALVQLADSLKAQAGGRLSGLHASMALWLTLAMQLRSGLLSTVSADAHASQGLELLRRAEKEFSDSAESQSLCAHVAAQCLCLWGEQGPGSLPKALELARELGKRHQLGGHFGPDAAKGTAPVNSSGHEALGIASALLLRLGEFSAARALWLAAGAQVHSPLPEKPAGLAMAWASGQQIPFALGFGKSIAQGALPETALGWLYFGRQLEPGSSFLDGPVENVLGNNKALLLPYVEELRSRHAGNSENWRLGLKYGLACLAALLVDEGLRVLAKARKAAAEQGREKQFLSRLNGMSPVARDWEDILREQ